MNREEIINKLIRLQAKEIDYWLLESNRVDREKEHGGSIVYKKIYNHYVDLREKLFDIMNLLLEVDEDD